MTRRAILDPRTGAAIPLSPAQASAVKAALDALTAERDRARATAVRLQQELAEVTRERDEARAELDRLRGNVQVLSVVTTGLQWPEGQWPEHQPEYRCPGCVPEDAGPDPALGAQFGPSRQEPQPRLPDPYGAPS